MAVQGLLGAGVTAGGGGDMIGPPHADATTVLRTVDIVVIDRDVKTLILDLEILIGLVNVRQSLTCMIKVIQLKKA